MAGQKEIRLVLENEVLEFAAANSITKVVREFVGSSVLPTTTHLRCEVTPLPTQDPSIGNYHRRFTGNFRVQYFEPMTGRGCKSLETMADKIADWFKRGSNFPHPTDSSVVVAFEYTPSISQVLQENNLIFITVDCVYRCDIITTPN